MHYTQPCHLMDTISKIEDKKSMFPFYFKLKNKNLLLIHEQIFIKCKPKKIELKSFYKSGDTLQMHRHSYESVDQQKHADSVKKYILISD